MTEPIGAILHGDADADARLAAIVDSSFDAIVGKDLNSVITSWNAAAQRLFGYTAEEAVGRSILMLIPEHLHGEETDIISRVKRGERVETFETTRRRKDGSLTAVSLTISPIRNRAGVIVGASKIARDISAAKESERRIKLLMREVNHRVKNQFAVILSMVRETRRRTVSPEEFEIRIRDRIMALSRSHDLLVSSDWSGASLFDLVQDQLAPFGRDARVSMSGPLVTLNPNAVQYLGMAFHELGTNSSKYGALGCEAGEVHVAWRIASGPAGGREIELTWEETSIPHIGERRDSASRVGFGSIVLQRATPQALGGEAVLKLEPGRLTWTLTAPFDLMVMQPVAEAARHPA